MMPQQDVRAPVPPEIATVFDPAGLTLLGISDADVPLPRQVEYDAWLQAGCHGEMEYLERHRTMKYHPERLLPGCRSLLIVGMNYYQDGKPSPGEGRIARYAWGRDYHKTLGNRLRSAARRLAVTHPGERFKAFTDTAPLDERFFAEHAGAGFIGRHTLLISSLYGSWFFLGEILSTRHWPATPPAGGRHGDCPSGCAKCLRICPTGALVAPGRMDARRCISYLTIEHKGTIPLDLREPMGNWIFGCDLCQEVCPFQLRRQPATEPGLLHRQAGPGLALDQILNMTEAEFDTRFAGSALRRAGLRCLKRNACIAAGNTRHPAARDVLRALAAADDPLLAEHAAWALDRYPAPDAGRECHAGPLQQQPFPKSIGE